MPRWTSEAANPTMSRTLPPPMARTKLWRHKFAGIRMPGKISLQRGDQPGVGSDQAVIHVRQHPMPEAFPGPPEDIRQQEIRGSEEIPGEVNGVFVGNLEPLKVAVGPAAMSGHSHCGAAPRDLACHGVAEPPAVDRIFRSKKRRT